MPNHHVQELIDKQEKQRYAAKVNCLNMYGTEVTNKHQGPYYNETSQSFMCPAFWDSAICWPKTPAGISVVKGCPSYITGVKAVRQISK
ncbi:hypothetical protein JTB14_017502 [Gonioctena quinquepunctata]|nr:hypothetical protein JTB14_017502 [Gonioctena quinquepunctata]